jgi:hypothetical protein
MVLLFRALGFDGVVMEVVFPLVTTEKAGREFSSFEGTWFFGFYPGPSGTGGKGRRGWIRRVLGGIGRVSWGTIVISPDEGRSTSFAAGSGSFFSRSSDLGFVWATASAFLANIWPEGKTIVP